MFLVFEGLDATGKTTAATLVSEKLGGLGPSDIYQRMSGARPCVDAITSSPYARFCYWMAINHAESDRVVTSGALEGGSHIVLDSYFLRTLVTHQVLGIPVDRYMDWDTVARPNLTFLLHTSAEVRMRRLLQRDGALYKNQWERTIFEASDEIDALYRNHQTILIDTSVLTLDELVQKVMAEIDAL